MRGMKEQLLELPLVKIVSLLTMLYFEIKAPELDRESALNKVKEIGTMAADLLTLIDPSNTEYQQDYQQERVRTEGRCGPYALPWLVGF
jgi:hypothetical protein